MQGLKMASTICIRILGLSAVVLILFGILGANFSTELAEIIALERLILKEGSEALELFKKSPVPTLTKIYFYNYTNADGIIEGETPKLEEIGPYVYSEIRESINTTLHENGTISYYPTKKIYFNRSLSVGDETDVINMVNLPVFAGANSLRYAPQQQRRIYSTALKRASSETFIKRSVNELLWGYEDFWVTLSQNLKPLEQMDHEATFGFMNDKNGTTGERFTIFTGRDSFQNYGHIDNWNGINKLPYWNSEKCNRFNGSTDGTTYPPKIDKAKTLYLFNPEFCRTLPMVFQKKVEHDGIEGYRFGPPKNLFDTAPENPDNECYCPANCTGQECGVRGIFNVSTCKSGAPLAISWPHFLYGDPQLIDSVKGLRPNPENHSFFVDIEPNIGKPLHVKARVQINLIFKRIDGIEQLAKIQDSVLPLFWFETGIDKLPDDILYKFRHVIMLPGIFLWISITMVALGVGLLSFVFWHLEKLVCLKETPELSPESVAAPGNSDETSV